MIVEGFYGDGSRLNDIKFKDPNPEQLQTVATEFSALFVQMALKAMREANEAFKSDYFNSTDVNFYEEMYDKQLALHLSSQDGFGIKQAVLKQLSARGVD